MTDQLVDLLDGADFILFKNGSNWGVRVQGTTSSLGAGATLTATYPIHTVSGTPGAVTLGGIANGHKTGQLLWLIGGSAANTVSLTYSATLRLNGDITLGQYDVLALMYLGGGIWVELWRNQ